MMKFLLKYVTDTIEKMEATEDGQGRGGYLHFENYISLTLFGALV